MFLISEVIIIIMLLMRIPRHLYCTYFRNNKNKPLHYKKIFLGTSGLGIASYLGYLVCFQEDLGDDIQFSRTVKLYAGLPLNLLSRVFGKFHHINLPIMLRAPVYHFYSYCTGANMEEMLQTDLTTYENLSQFFRRQIKPELRPQDQQHCLTSPCDGTVLYLGRVFEGHVEQVKGKSYTLQSFLGPPSWINIRNNNYWELKRKHSLRSSTLLQPINGNSTEKTSHSISHDTNLIHLNKRMDHGVYHKLLSSRDTHYLYHCIIYLAPGDYHRFHSPCNWSVNMRRHFYGKLLSVNPKIAARIIGLFAVNERAVYIGEWEHGFFSYAAVGATNVGSINIYKDPSLKTNQASRKFSPNISSQDADTNTDISSTHSEDVLDENNNKSKEMTSPSRGGGGGGGRCRINKCNFDDKQFTGSPLSLEKGDLFGEFNFGSTIVLIFEAPYNFEFCVQPNEKIKVGEALGGVKNVQDDTLSTHNINCDIQFQ